MADYGQLVPTGGGDTIYLKKEKLLIGRRENCDIVLRFSNVSGQHARMTLESGYWFMKDLASRNGTKVDGYRISRKRLDPVRGSRSPSMSTPLITRRRIWGHLVHHRPTMNKSNKFCDVASWIAPDCPAAMTKTSFPIAISRRTINWTRRC